MTSLIHRDLGGTGAREMQGFSLSGVHYGVHYSVYVHVIFGRTLVVMFVVYGLRPYSGPTLCHDT